MIYRNEMSKVKAELLRSELEAARQLNDDLTEVVEFERKKVISLVCCALDQMRKVYTTSPVAADLEDRICAIASARSPEEFEKAVLDRYAFETSLLKNRANGVLGYISGVNRLIDTVEAGQRCS